MVEVDRLQSTTNLNRKQWTAIQAKDLQKSMPEDRFKELIKKRQEQGLYYADEDWPEDPQDCGSKNCVFNVIICVSEGGLESPCIICNRPMILNKKSTN